MNKLFLIAAAVLFISSSAFGAVIYEDVVYWRPNGITEINPTSPPIDALIKIQETVYDCEQGPAIVDELLFFGLLNVGVTPAPGTPFELYAYSITNLNYGRGAGGAGNGISGFNLSWGGLGIGQWAPKQANDAWNPASANSGLDPEWDIDANKNQYDGDGVGILKSQTAGGFLGAVPCGTPHGFIGMNNDVWAHTWIGGSGIYDEQPNKSQADIIYGIVSGPVPEPATIGLMLIGLLAVARRRK